jgi:hypothetical protein
MIRTTLFTLFFGLTGCSVHAHTPKQPPPQQYHPPVARTHAPHHNQAPVRVKAWVWVKAHQDARGVWHHGHWELRTIPRHMVNRHPHTHVRHVKGRGRPAPPARRYR